MPDLSRGAKPRERHAWCRVKVHVYVCTKCGCGRVNEDMGRGHWRTRFYKPDGTAEDYVTPLCVIGPKTAAALRKYESAIAVGGLPKETTDDRLG